MSPVDLGRVWEDAVRSALLGTERQSFALSTDGSSPDSPAIERALAALAGREEEARLLGAAALVSLYRRIGARPARDERAEEEPAPEDDAPFAPPAAARFVVGLLGNANPILFHEWLALAAARGVVAPHELLPALLDAGAARAELRDGIVRVLGARGRWLAAQDARWAWAAASDDLVDDEKAWETATADARAVILRRVRRTDPARGLALAQSTWESDPAKDRAAFLPILADGLSDADEPFLESALDDRAKTVRRAAAELLRRLPGSRLVARMTERARPLLRIHPPKNRLLPGRMGKPSAEVRLPDACTPEMQRDGIEPTPPLGTGEKAWWLRQMVAAVPPSVWSGDAGLPPSECIDAARRGEFDGELLAAWSAAAASSGDAEWAEALARHGAEDARVDLRAVLAALPPDRARALALELAGGGRSRIGKPALRLLQLFPYPFGPELTRAVLARGPSELAHAFWQLQWQMDPRAAVDVFSGWDPSTRGWTDLLQQRHALHEAFAS